MKEDETTDILLIGGAIAVAYFLFLKPKTAKPLIPGQITSITPINYGGSAAGNAANTASLITAGGGLISTLKNIFSSGSTPSQSNIIKTNPATGEAGFLPDPVNSTSDPANPFANLTPIASNSPINVPGTSSNDSYVYDYGTGEDEYSYT